VLGLKILHLHVGCVILSLIIGMSASCADRPVHANRTPAGDYLDSPVFYELYFEEYADTSNLSLLPSNKLHIKPFRVKDVENFSWHNPRIANYSWWLQVESLRFLLPLIKSTDPAHRSLARSWLEDWCSTHREYASPNRAAWDRMTAAIRAMVLVYYLKKEEMYSQGSKEVIELLLREIDLHQKILSKKEGFSFNSNHGLMETMGLLETTRVYPEPRALEIGLCRLESIATSSVSKKGIHMEHSCGYHFYFMNWLLDYYRYMKSHWSIEDWDSAPVDVVAEQMKLAAYYMQDHDGNIPPIGDTDPGRVADVISYDDPGEPAKFCFDGEAGFAIYKDDSKSKTKRYMVFNIQNTEPEMPYHFHNDALAVYFNYDGEALLGDQGRYDYSTGGRRTYFVSHRAHNTIFPLARLDLSRAGGDRKLVTLPWWNREGNTLFAGAKLSYPGISAKRGIAIPDAGWPFVISDTLSGSAPAVLLWNIGFDVTRITINKGEESGAAQHEWILHTKKNRKFSLSIDVSEQTTLKKHTVELLKGSSKPFLGWYAPEYRKSLPSSVIKLTLYPDGKVYVTTRIRNIE
jgi:hypothetical protein